MINPTAINGIGPLRNANPLAAANPLAGNANGNAVSPLGDGSAISPEAQGQDGDLGQMMQALMQAFGMGQDQQQSPEQRIQQLQQEIAQTEQQLGQAQQSGDQEAVQGLTQKLDALKAELAQLTGQGAGQEGGGAPAGGGGEGAPAGGGGGAPQGGGGGGAPAGGGGAPAGGGGAPAGGGGAPSGGGSAPSGGGNDGGAAPIGGANGANQGGDAGPLGQTSQVPPELAGDDQKMAQFIESKLQGTPLAGQGLGAHFVQAGKQNGVDPLVLASISKHETNHGKLGVGTRKHMGVGAFDSSPNKARKWDGAVNQIYSGAKTFANLRKKYGSNENMPLAHQLRAVNGNGTRSGWATDTNWHNKVGNTYNSYASSAKSFTGGGNTAVASSTPKASTTKKA
ncbi:MAG: glucosaminidase domain-containing protein [Candidatus Eremiobacteraeota bacterium]|nr:glucosaminidase domain-containing protein [Candidatus Eremiobacteraeota bacterium]